MNSGILIVHMKYSSGTSGSQYKKKQILNTKTIHHIRNEVQEHIQQFDPLRPHFVLSH